MTTETLLIIFAWALVGVAGCGVFAALGYWATWSRQPELSPQVQVACRRLAAAGA